MAQGGSRPGAGRPRLTDEEKQQSSEARRLRRKTARAAKQTPKKKAAAKPETVAVAPAGVKTAEEQSWPFGAVPPAEPAPAPETEPADPGEPAITADTPLGFLLEVVKQPGLKLSVRMQAAALAAPYVHAKPAPLGKKDEKAKGAKVAAGGRFAAAAPPRLVSSR